MTQSESDKALAEFLANGGVIQQAAYRESGRVEGAGFVSPWGARKKAGRPPAGDGTEPPVEAEEGDE